MINTNFPRLYTRSKRLCRQYGELQIYHPPNVWFRWWFFYVPFD